MGKKSANNGFNFDTEKFAPTSWGQPKAVDETFEHTTPSGQLVLLKRVGMESILELGLFDKLDFFTKAMAEDDETKPATDKKDDSFAQNVLKNFGQMKQTIHKILLVGVVAPVLAPVPDPPAARKDGVVYVDTVPFEDAIDLFSEILDSDGLASFRKEPASGVGDVPAEQALQSTPE